MPFLNLDPAHNVGLFARYQLSSASLLLLPENSYLAVDFELLHSRHCGVVKGSAMLTPCTFSSHETGDSQEQQDA
jgi:hypothetical protein